jgi:hypothetical protein
VAPPIKYPKISKTCPICCKEFETSLGSKAEKTYCSLFCSNKDKPIVEDKKEKAKMRAKEYRKTHPEWTRATQKRARKKLKETAPEHLIWMETKKRAKKRGIPFEIEVSDVVIPKVCPILGIELSFGVGRVHDASPSLDRIVPEKGYVKDNCFIISSKANRMKQENTLETLEKIIAYIKERVK